MVENQWRRRIDRARELADRDGFAAEVLRFYAAIARIQEELYLENGEYEARRESVSEAHPFERPLDAEIMRGFRSFLSIVENTGTPKLSEAARDLGKRDPIEHFDLLKAFWEGDFTATVSDTDDFFARAFLQPYGVCLRERFNLQWKGPTAYVCPFCKRKPGIGVLRPLGDGGQRSLVCSFCLGEWEFRRILCPGCGEMDPAKLPVYAAEEMPHVRVEACDSCKCYIKTVDLTKSALGEPIVDELASVPLDLWARARGYSKLQLNLLQL